MKVAFTRSARADLTAIGRYILEHNPSRADAFLDELLQCCLEIADMPEAFALVHLPRVGGMRRRVFERYLIFYKIDETTVTIVRILHGARNYERILARQAKRNLGGSDA
ncbi:MAG: type II toxin-antitoxin system RelE/ParE family toxin [Alphaproteobacteria bacterium]|nr:type II toxin-antitoxin system RelE/ParE family toxin [Rhizobiaceae bacterium]MBU3960789.1 type II toxin-antitoxin system RelE/ParE family toxin [Alphaproteobacteria bacterium]MBU4052054.1 type II toxin-antitoxin system RelE/ParE family toxin [Alphaproteobacteria bacterium]MBU4089965.1 type II toxin-antitoxin system RelE/ParE family toxin [Alphaproteobacteria bacterium]MBU4158477.1 type II toxin-antitoxin system RelE/ParE family toxin [Alphaproteobacteria bacterium]